MDKAKCGSCKSASTCLSRFDCSPGEDELSILLEPSSGYLKLGGGANYIQLAPTTSCSNHSTEPPLSVLAGVLPRERLAGQRRGVNRQDVALEPLHVRGRQRAAAQVDHIAWPKPTGEVHV